MKLLKSIFVIIIFIVISSENLLSQWIQIGLPSDRIVSLGTQSNGYLYAGTYYNGLYRSTDSGNSWTQVLGTNLAYEVYSIAFDSSGGVLAGTHSNGLFRSTNFGNSWTLLSSDFGTNNLPVDDIYSVAVSPNGNIFAVDGASLIGAIYRSLDLGINWQALLLPSGGILTLAASVDGTLYAGGGAWFYYSTNGGDSWIWKGSSSGLTHAPLILVAGKDIGLVFAGTSGGGVFISTNNGENWNTVNTGLSNNYITALYLQDSILFAGTDGDGVFVSFNKGSNWYQVGNGFSNSSVYSLTAADSILYAGTYSNGIWSIPISQIITSVARSNETIPLQFQLEQNYPNPFNPTTKISWQSPVSSWQTLKVYDVLGNEIATLVNEELSAGEYEVEFNTSSIKHLPSSGVYFYQLKARRIYSNKKNGSTKMT